MTKEQAKKEALLTEEEITKLVQKFNYSSAGAPPGWWLREYQKMCQTQQDKDWPIAKKEGKREEQKRMTRALRELHKKGWTLTDVIEAEDTCGED